MSDVPPAGDQPEWPNPAPSQSQPSNGVGIGALVVGIVSVVLCWLPFVGLTLAIVAVVLGIVGIRKASRGEATNKGMAIAGVVTGGFALFVGALFTIGTIALFNSDEFQDVFECLQNAETAEEQQACQEQFEQDVGQ